MVPFRAGPEIDPAQRGHRLAHPFGPELPVFGHQHEPVRSALFPEQFERFPGHKTGQTEDTPVRQAHEHPHEVAGIVGPLETLDIDGVDPGEGAVGGADGEEHLTGTPLRLGRGEDFFPHPHRHDLPPDRLVGPAANGLQAVAAEFKSHG